MQISAANFLIASQQGAKPATSASSGSEAFAASLAKEASDFAPLSFKSVAPETNATATTASPTSQSAAPIGSQIDIRV